jgi:site-specific recombinase XerD
LPRPYRRIISTVAPKTNRPRTIQWYEQKLRHFTEWLRDAHAVEQVEELTSAHIREFIIEFSCDTSAVNRGRKLRRGKPSSLTVHGYAQVIKTFCRWLVTTGCLATSPWGTLAMPRVEHYQVQAFTAEDIRAMLKAAQLRRHGERDYLITLLLYDTAIRANELARLTLDDIDFTGAALTGRDPES